jgi:hypothetical protein
MGVPGQDFQNQKFLKRVQSEEIGELDLTFPVARLLFEAGLVSKDRDWGGATINPERFSYFRWTEYRAS